MIEINNVYVPAAGKSILFNTGMISRSFSMARYTFARVYEKKNGESFMRNLIIQN